MQNKYIHRLQERVIQRFGQNAFTPFGEGLGTNHLVFRSNDSKRRMEISVVAGGEGHKEDAYSIQVEVDIDQPDLEIPFVAKDLSITEALEVFGKYQKYP
jgi:hypothetical protein